MLRETIWLVKGKGKLYVAAPSMCTVCRVASELFIRSSASCGTKRMWGSYRQRFWSRKRLGSGRFIVFPLEIFFRNTTVFATPPCGPIISRSRSRILCDSGSQISGSLLMEKVGMRGNGPDHLTVPAIVPGLLRD